MRGGALALVALGLCSACGRAPGTDSAARSGVAGVGPENGRLVLRAVNYPLQYFAPRIGGETEFGASSTPICTRCS